MTKMRYPLVPMLIKVMLFICGITTAEKEAKLSMLTFLPIDASGQTTWPSCNVTAQIVFDYVNSRNDILPNYKLVQRIENEGPNALLANAGLLRSYRDQPADDKNVLSPVIIGPTIACHVVAHAMRELHFTTFSPQCAGPYIVGKRKLLSTLYSAWSPAATSIAAKFAVITKIGGWREIAIITNANNPNEYLEAQMQYKAAAPLGIDVIHYANEYDITMDTVNALKASGARIVIVMIVQLPLCLKLLCLAYTVGIRAPLHVFIMSTFNCMYTPDSQSLPVPPGCSRDILALQLKGTIFAGVYASRVGSISTQTTLGYNVSYYEEKYNEATNNRKPVDYESRHLCHDAIMAGILTLNKSDEKLRRDYNLSLKDFMSNPEIVGSVVNYTAAKIDFIGSRIGRFAYSDRAELREDLWIGQMVENKLRMLYRMPLIEGTNLPPYDLAAYNMVPLEKIIWFTKTGNPPKDLSQAVHREVRCGSGMAGTVSAFSALISLCQIVAFAFAWKRHNQHAESEPFFSFSQKLLLLFGCLMLNASAVVLLLGSDYFPNAECSFRPVLTCLGLSVVNAILFIQITAYSQLFILPSRSSSAQTKAGTSRYNKPGPTGNQKSTSGTVPATTSSQASNGISTVKNSTPVPITISPRARPITIIGIVTAISVPVIILAVWIGFDPLTVTYESSPIVFDEDNDTYYDIKRSLCWSNYQIYWLAALLVVEGCLLFCSAFFAYAIDKRIKASAYGPACNRFRAAVANAVILFCGILLVLLVVSSSSLPCIQVAVLAFGDLIYSASLSGFMFYPRAQR